MTQTILQGSTFKEAFPYGVTTLATGVAGVVISLACAATALKVAGVILALVGAWSFFGVLFCSVVNSDNSNKFKEELPKYVTVTVAFMLANMIQSIAMEIISRPFRHIFRFGPFC